ncbi:hypothetical protein JQ543_12015 [Bradyrhizobium diazoefficiens]|nr:hypothetical protein [Bradyrhizobium diazoefficiens]MBR0848468.1 hypothetical protein [Bradyrhizobium diazoefficiens]
MLNTAFTRRIGLSCGQAVRRYLHYLRRLTDIPAGARISINLRRTHCRSARTRLVYAFMNFPRVRPRARLRAGRAGNSSSITLKLTSAMAVGQLA